VARGSRRAVNIRRLRNPAIAHAVILAVPHQDSLDQLDRIVSSVREGGVFIDVKSLICAGDLRDDLSYWSL